MSTEEKIIQPSEAVDVMLDALAKYLIEASNEKNFCGVTIDEARDTDGKLLAVSDESAGGYLYKFTNFDELQSALRKIFPIVLRNNVDWTFVPYTDKCMSDQLGSGGYIGVVIKHG